MNNIDLWQFLAGTAVFLFAMSLMEDSFKKLGSRSFKKFLQKNTSTAAKSILSGTVVTALLQSSSVVIVMTLSFVGAGIMKLSNAFAVTVGANLGTTLDSWIVAILGFKLNLEKLSFPLLGVSLIIQLFFGANYVIKNIASAIFGFALLFLGLEWMKGSMQGIVSQFDFTTIQKISPYLFILIGIIITALIQSSSAVVAITLAALSQNILSFDRAACIVIGTELGTSVKFLIGSIYGTPDKKRLALGNSLYNLAMMIVSTILLYPILHLIQHGMMIKDQLIGLVSFQTGINILGTLLVWPFIHYITQWLQKRYTENEFELQIMPEGAIVNPDKTETQFITSAQKELNRILTSVLDFNKKVFSIDQKEQKSTLFRLLKASDPLLARAESYKSIKSLHGQWWEEVLEWQEEINDTAQLKNVNQMLEISQYIMHAAKNMKDISHNLDEFRATANDHLFAVYNDLKNEVENFYNLYNLTISSSSISIETRSTLMNVIETVNEKYEYEIKYLLKEDAISDVDATSFMNVLREIKNAHTSLVNASVSFK